MEVDMLSHPRQIVSNNLVAFIKRIGLAILRKMNASRRLWKTSRRKRYGALRIAWTKPEMYKARILSILFSKLTICQPQTIFFFRRKIILNKEFTSSKDINIHE